jgi:site-specific recombinase XerD
MMKEAGIPTSAVQDFIGHDDKTTSRHYTHTGSDALRKAAEALPILEI